MKTKQTKKQKVFILMQFPHPECEPRVHSVYSSRDKAEERAEHLKKQFVTTPTFTVGIIKKSITGKVT